MIIAVTKSINSFSGSPLVFNMQDLATSSFCLKEDGLKLIKFLNYHCIEISKETLIELQSTYPVVETHFSYINLGDIFIYIATEVNWETINILWALRSSLDKIVSLRRVISNNEDNKITLYQYQQLSNEYLQKLSNFKVTDSPYFNALRFLSSCKLLKIKTKITNKKIAMYFDNVKLGNNSEGQLLYNQIIVIIDGEGLIDGFLLYFNDFAFSSYWNLPIILHPYLSVGCAFNQSLSFINRNDISYAEAIRDTVQNYTPNSGIKSISSILLDFQVLRKLWYGLKDSVDEKELNKFIFTEFNHRTEILTEITSPDDIKF